mgnify:CR=1 FL=1
MCLTHENGKDDAEMEQLYLMPGEERCTKFQDENGVPKICYTYCSLHGKLFNCTCRSKDEAQRLCEDWNFDFLARLCHGGTIKGACV